MEILQQAAKVMEALPSDVVYGDRAGTNGKWNR